MKIKTKRLSYNEVLALPKAKHKLPKKPNLFFRLLLRLVSLPDLLATRFKCRKVGMERLGKREPCLFLMNHSSFIDLEIAATVLFPRPFNIVCTTDGFIGKNWLMRQIGCIPTSKFVTDLSLIHDMHHALKTQKSSVLMFPEAGYSFDGTETPLPSTVGRLIRMLDVPVVMIRTYGAFSRDPLYNNLQRRKVDVSAEMTYLLSPEDIKSMTDEEIGVRIKTAFHFDNFRWQQENHIRIAEGFRADGLERLLYKCPHCLTEGKTVGKGTDLVCHACGKRYTLTEYGYMEAADGETEFPHIPDWFHWQREEVKKELERGEYRMESDVDIAVLTDAKCLYLVGEGHLSHTIDGFHLTGCDGTLDYHHSPIASHTLNSDFNWYEIGDMISFGHQKMIYVCFLKSPDVFAAKARLATEELYKMLKAKKETKA